MDNSLESYLDGRIRLGSQYRFSIEEANALKYKIEEFKGISYAYIYRRTGSILKNIRTIL